MRERLESWLETSQQIEFKILETFARGPMVINHRIDRFISTSRPLTWEGVGVFFVKDGKIKPNDVIVIISGSPMWVRGTTNLLKLHRVGERRS